MAARALCEVLDSSSTDYELSEESGFESESEDLPRPAAIARPRTVLKNVSPKPAPIRGERTLKNTEHQQIEFSI